MIMMMMESVELNEGPNTNASAQSHSHPLFARDESFREVGLPVEREMPYVVRPTHLVYRQRSTGLDMDPLCQAVLLRQAGLYRYAMRG